MKIMKFGGTSVGRPERMVEISHLITQEDEPKIIVMSALSGTTNSLVEISDALSKSDRIGASEKIEKLKKHYEDFVTALYKSPEGKAAGAHILADHFEFLDVILKISYSESLNKDILAQGELLSTKIFSAYLNEIGVKHAWLPALEFMTIDAAGEPQVGSIRVKLAQVLRDHSDTRLFVTQGFICRNARGEVDNLKRGGSDYTASLIAAAVGASVCEIWTDIDGMHNNDPRIVQGTTPVRKLSFNEAAELAYFGAKILHPASIWPAQHYNFPVRLLNTMEPHAPGTVISSEASEEGVKAIAAKDAIIAVKIKSSRMLLAYGFLRKIFDVFEKYRTSIDMVTTSEVAVSLTIDSDTHLMEIVKELEMYGNITIDHGQTIICVVGNKIALAPNILIKIFDSLNDIPVRMVSFGGSRDNVSILVPGEYKEQALRQLHSGVFN
ncbi:MAG TPA: aspartate kinase [Ginsengibacter sp.]|nr:aspartate kinase [Chitinophagaceae bacterium]HRN73555.1 aspartate kinase [Ginsengibacter sp.]HRP44323.1 aspartate kinase [Ginsengibacter sp.]